MPRTRTHPLMSETATQEMFQAFLQSVVPLLDHQTLQRLRRRGRKRRRKRGMTIGRLCQLYLEHCQAYYTSPAGGITSEVSSVEHALRPLRQSFARTQVDDFGPRRFREVRDEMIRMDWCRRYINQQMGRIKRMFKWGVANELITPTAYHRIQPVDGLRAGRGIARESKPVKPVPEELITGVVEHVSAQIAAMIRLQLATGMRPGEVCIMRTCDIDRDRQLWLYRPMHHKTAHHEHERVIFLGPTAQQVIRPFLNNHAPEAFLFSPAEADKARRAVLHARRVTPLSCGNRPGTNRKRRPRKRPGDSYARCSYARVISRACQLAFPAPAGLGEDEVKAWHTRHHWHPHQLRHNAATRLRKEFGIEVAQVVLGHKTLLITQVYAEKDVEAAEKAMLQIG